MINSARSVAVIRHVWQILSTSRASAIMVSFAAVCAMFPQTRAATDDPSRYRGGLRNSPGERRLNAKQLDAVLASLRDKTGLLEMRFDEGGFLTLGDRTKFSGGSTGARALVEAATAMAHVVELESHMYSSQIAFARLAKPTAYQRYLSGAKIDVVPLEIDFSDLSNLRGDRQALAAFDLGFVILHELGHTAFGLSDAAGDPHGLGECEALINRIRRELNLPERQTYVAQIRAARPVNPSHISAQFAELVFARSVEKRGRTRVEQFNLYWDASIGPITQIESRGSKIEDIRSKIKDRGSRIDVADGAAGHNDK
jgi:hypothetical protein